MRSKKIWLFFALVLGILISLTGAALVITYIFEAIELNPTDILAHNSFAWFLATCTESKYRDGKRAVKLAEKVLSIEKNAVFFDTLAAAYAEDNRFDDAIKTQETAIKLLEKDGMTDELSEFKKHLDSYRTGKPWREG